MLPVISVGDMPVTITVKSLANGVKAHIERAGGSIEIIAWPKSIRYINDYTTAVYEDVVPDQPLRRGEKVPGEIRVTLPAGTLHRQDDFSKENGVKWVRYAWMLPTGVILGWVDEDTPPEGYDRVNGATMESLFTFETPSERRTAEKFHWETWKDYFGF